MRIRPPPLHASQSAVPDGRTGRSGRSSGYLSAPTTSAVSRQPADQDVHLRRTDHGPGHGTKTPTHALTSCRPTRSVSIIAWRGACAGRFSAVSILSPSATTIIARNGSANDSSGLHRFSRSISALPIQLDKYLSLLDWTGRQFRAASQGAIPTQLAAGSSGDDQSGRRSEPIPTQTHHPATCHSEGRT